MNKQDDQSTLDDAGIEELLQQVGGRHEPAPDIVDAVRNAVHAQWLSTVRARKRQRTMVFAMAAGIACAAVTATFMLRTDAPELVAVATVARIDGHLQIVAGKDHEAMVGRTLTSGSTLRTDANSRAAFDFGNGVSVRVDADSGFTLAAADRIVLDYGALYVDASSVDASGSPNVPAGKQAVLKIETAAGSIRHLGTQYQVRAQHEDIVASVREGRIEISSAHGTNVGEAGERLRLSGDGNVQRSRIQPQDASWQWAEKTAPTFDIAGQPLAAFLRWVARETGRKLVYESAQAQSLAQSVRLSGSIAGLDPEAALAAVLPTTSLRWHKTKDDSLRIGIAGAVEPAAKATDPLTPAPAMR